jgi:hypothetical protein
LKQLACREARQLHREKNSAVRLRRQALEGPVGKFDDVAGADHLASAVIRPPPLDEGDFFEDDFGGGWDVALLNHVALSGEQKSDLVPPSLRAAIITFRTRGAGCVIVIAGKAQRRA